MRRHLIVSLALAGAALAGNVRPAWAICPQTNIATLYVATVGDDGNDGLFPLPSGGRNGPLATPTGARNKLRQYRASGCLTTTAPVRVKIAAGEYYLPTALQLEPQDSGTASAPVVFEAADPNQKPVLSGGQRITGFLADGNGRWQVWRQEFMSSAPGQQWNFEQLWVNGRRAVPARWPNRDRYSESNPQRGFFPHADYPAGEDPENAKRYFPVDGQIVAALNSLTAAQLSDVQVTHMGAWTISRNFVEGLDLGQNRINLSGKMWVPPQWGSAKSRLEFLNVPFALDAPGEFYLDRTSGVLSYLPFPGESPLTAEVIAPRAQELVRFASDTGARIHHVQLLNLRLRHSGYLLRRAWIDADKFTGGYNDSYGAFSLPAAVSVAQAEDVTLSGLEIAHTGGSGVWIRGGSERVTLSDSVLYDLGGGGVKILEYDPAVAYSIAHSNAGSVLGMGGHHAIVNNVIHSGGRSFYDANGILISLSAHNTIAHNDVADFYNSGISFFSGRRCDQRYRSDDFDSQDNHVRFNRIHQIGQDVLSDLGGIYVFGSNAGTTIDYNQVSLVRHWDWSLDARLNHAGGYAGEGIYLDAGSHGVTVENNLFYDLESSGLRIGPGLGRVVENNIFAFTQESAYWLGTGFCSNPAPPAGSSSLALRHNIAYFETYNWPANPGHTQGHALESGVPPFAAQTIDFNLYFKVGGAPDFRAYPLATPPSPPPPSEVRPFGPASSTGSWQSYLKDSSSMVANPLFLHDPSEWDFTLDTASPAFQAPVDFHAIVPPEEIGVESDSPAHAFAGRLDGGPADFGGMFGFGDGITVYGNPFYGGRPSCAPGYTETRLVGTLGTDNYVSYCHRPLDDLQPLAEFGGMYGTVDHLPQPNQLTQDSTCPAGFTATPVHGASVDEALTYCQRPHPFGQAVPYPFGGLYGYYVEPLSNRLTWNRNPLNGQHAACLHPGFEASRVLGSTPPGVLDYNAFWCVPVP